MCDGTATLPACIHRMWIKAHIFSCFCTVLDQYVGFGTCKHCERDKGVKVSLPRKEMKKQ